MKKLRPALVFLVLALPIALLFILKDGEIVSTQLPIYGERYYDTEIGDTVYHTLSDFSFIDQEGDTLTRSDLEGKIIVANFFFTSCPDICPAMMQNIRFVYNKFKDSPDIRFLSMTVDPARDSVPVLAQYGYSLGAAPKHWYLVTGSKAALYGAAEHDFLVAAVKTDLKSAFIHSDRVVLIDPDFRIRGYYVGTEFSNDEMLRLNDDIKALVVEYHDRTGKK